MSSSINEKGSGSHTYDDDQVVVVKDDIADLNHSGPSKISGEKSFICSIFYEYIKNNCVRVRDVYTLFKDINSDLHMKNIDILDDLLCTNKFEVLSSNQSERAASCTSKSSLLERNMSTMPVSHQETPASIEDVYDSLVNDEIHTREPLKSKPLENITASPVRFNRRIKCEEAAEEPVARDQMQRMIEKISYLQEQIKNKDTVISLFDNERGAALLEKEQMCDVLNDRLSDLQIKYNILEEENMHMKEEINDLKFSKRKLEMMKGVHSQTKGIDVVKGFQNEIKIITDRIKAEYEQKFEKKMKEMKEKINLVEKPKMTELFDDVLKNLFLCNKSVIAGLYDQAELAVDVLDTVNQWFEETLCSKNFIDTSKWLSRLKILQRIMKDYEERCKRLLQQEKKSIGQFDLPHIPDAPPEKLGETIKNAFAAFYMNQCQVLDAALNAIPQKNVDPTTITMPLVGPVKDCWENHRVPWTPLPMRKGSITDEIPEIELSRYELQDEARALPDCATKSGIDEEPATVQDSRETSTPPPDRLPAPDVCWNCWSSSHTSDQCDQRRRVFCRACGLTGWITKECYNCNADFTGAKPKRTRSRNSRRNLS